MLFLRFPYYNYPNPILIVETPPYYATFMELEPRNQDKNCLVGPNFIMVVYMDPLYIILLYYYMQRVVFHISYTKPFILYYTIFLVVV